VEGFFFRLAAQFRRIFLYRFSHHFLPHICVVFGSL
jgi:hypothetical protein